MMKMKNKKWLSFVTFLIFLGIIITPVISSVSLEDYSIFSTDDTEEELALLHGETLIYLWASSSVDSVNFTYAVPPIYGNQTPIFIEIRDDTVADIISYKIVNDSNQPNKVIKFEIGAINAEEKPSLHFDFWVLVKNNDYSDLPDEMKIPNECELPEESKTWLTSTKAIQSDNILIKHKARQLRRFTFNDLDKLADKIVKYTSFHRPFISFIFNFVLRNGHAQDAVTSFLLGNVCTGAANLGAALFRSNGVPAKDLIVMPCLEEFWFAMHFISEYYCPEYGWILAETSFGINPHQPKENIILRVNYPKDEEEAGNMFSGHGGVEQWFWIEPKNVYLDMDFVESGTRAFIEKELMVDEQIATIAFDLTQEVYELHTRYSGVELVGDNMTHFDNAILAQQNAIQCFNQSDVIGYYDNMTIAYDEYRGIEYP